MPPVQTPLAHASAVVQALPSLQAVPSALAGFEHMPVDVEQVPAVWHWSLAVQVLAVPPPQTPLVHVSAVVQAFPSSQVAPSALAGFEHIPVDAAQVPAVWH